MRRALWLGLGLCFVACSLDPIRVRDHTVRDGGSDGGSDKQDAAAGADASEDAATVDASEDAAHDAGHDSGHDSGFDATTPPQVEPLYAAASGWNDYVLATNLATPCTASTLPRELGVCVHGGPLRKLELPDLTSCTGITASDDADWFDWVCEASGSSVRMRSTGLRAGIGLRELLDPSAAQFATNFVTVRNAGVVIAKSAVQRFWDNPVYEVPSDVSAGVYTLDVPRAVYVVRATPIRDLNIGADGVALVLPKTGTLGTLTTGTLPLLRANSRSFVWIEGGGTLDTSGHDAGVDLDLRFSFVDALRAEQVDRATTTLPALQIQAEGCVLRALASHHAGALGVRLSGTHDDVSGLEVRYAKGSGVELLSSSSRVANVSVVGAGGDGVVVQLVDALWLEQVRVASSGQAGVSLQGVTDSVLHDVAAANNTDTGISVDRHVGTNTPSTSNLLMQLETSNNGWDGLSLAGANHVAIGVTSMHNTNGGIGLRGDSSILMHATVAACSAVGVVVTGAKNTLVNLVTLGNEHGLNLGPTSSSTRLHELVVADNASGMSVQAAPNVFSGSLRLATANDCTVTDGLINAGIEDMGGCSLPAPSSGVVVAPFSAVGMLVGKLANGDPQNGSYGALGAQGTALSGVISDWFVFGAATRHYGLAGSSSSFTSQVRGRCTGSVACAVWDARTSGVNDLRDYLGEPTLTSTLEDPAQVITHTWSATMLQCSARPSASWSGSECSSRLVGYALEPLDDGSGNDNGLCEPGELCLQSRNRGGHPGEGSTVSVGTPSIAGLGTFTLQRYASP